MLRVQAETMLVLYSSWVFFFLVVIIFVNIGPVTLIVVVNSNWRQGRSVLERRRLLVSLTILVEHLIRLLELKALRLVAHLPTPVLHFLPFLLKVKKKISYIW